MKYKVLAVGLILMLPQFASAKDNLATKFVNEVKTAADGNGEVNASIDIECPAKSASGKILVSKASYEIDKSVGAFVFKNTNDTPARMTSIVTISPDDNFMSDEVIGMSYIFQMPGGQYFVDVLKSGKAKSGININGKSGITWVDCKIVKPS